MSTSPHRVSVIGASGYAGAELLSLLDRDARFEVVAAVADRWAGERLDRRLPTLDRLAGLEVRAMADAVAASAGAEVALLATPAEGSLTLAPALLARGVRVVDLSGAFRLRDAAAYRRWYGAEHTAVELLAEAVYGLPEVAEAHGGELGPGTRLVANPGCYPTAAVLALAPLLRAGLIEPTVYIDGKSGVTGAGRKVEERLMFTEIDESVSPYRVGNHQHTPEIEQALGRVAGRPVSVTFTPHLLPLRRGMLVTAFAALAPGVEAEQVAAAMTTAYQGQRAVRVRSPGDVSIAATALTSLAVVGAHGDGERRSVVALGSIDNLRKGASSQALQNLCLLTGENFTP
ncbi:MAG: N-acetyl-gamma-glutamyl-phosphate reductase [Myxococcales bacterium]|nr:MAG: N-acetyl-gamma-glutamyl-phosphate reductase [Myxococcales bacterium]